MTTLPNIPAPKNSGLALLADTANEEQGTYHYPVRRRGLPRALLPNWDAIRWLEADKRETEIEYTENSEADGLLYTFAYGRIGKSYPRPMFQVIHDRALSDFRGVSGTACPCGDFSRSMYCPDCQELEYDWNQRTWIRPGTWIWHERHPEDRPTPPQPTAYADTGALFARIIDMFGQPLPSYAEQERRRQESSLQGLWVTAEQVQNYGTSRCTCEQCRIRYVGDASSELNLTSAPGVLSGDYDRWVDRVLGLQDVRVEGVLGEGSFTFEIEEDRGGDTA